MSLTAQYVTRASPARACNVFPHRASIPPETYTPMHSPTKRCFTEFHLHMSLKYPFILPYYGTNGPPLSRLSTPTTRPLTSHSVERHLLLLRHITQRLRHTPHTHGFIGQQSRDFEVGGHNNRDGGDVVLDLAFDLLRIDKSGCRWEFIQEHAS